MNRSFAAVGAYSTGGAAYTTGEVNLTGDRPLRVRSISVDAHLLKALSIQPEQDASLVTKKLRVGLGRYRHRSQFSPTNCGEQHLDNDRSLDKSWKSRAAPRNRWHYATRADAMDNHTQVWLPLWLIRIWPQREAMSLRHCATERWRHR